MRLGSIMVLLWALIGSAPLSANGKVGLLITVKPSHQDSPLTQSTSPFLQQFARQSVQWQPWGPDIFREAKRRGLPIFLTSGASWCHWCLQMGDETFTDETLSALLNEKYIPVLIDRDLSPEIDRRYQRVVLTLTGNGGWPLVAVLTPEGDVMYGGGYFSAADWEGHPGLIRILEDLSTRYTQDRETLEASAKKTTQRAQAIERILAGHPPPAAKAASPDEELPWNPRRTADHMVGSILDSYDPVNGGFGYTPRFPQAAALEMLLSYAEHTGLPGPLERVTHTLDAMADGAIRDPLTGLFFRYAEDAAWQKPGFEVLLSTNAELLNVYLHAFQLTKNPRYQRVALELTEALLTYMQLPGGGFAASLSGADLQGTTGGYYTWNTSELETLLTPEELAVATIHLGLDSNVATNDVPGAYVPHQSLTLPQVARYTGFDVEQTQTLLQSALDKMKKARNLRPPQERDETFFVPWNMQLCSALLRVDRAFDIPQAQYAALIALDKVQRSLGPESTAVPLTLSANTSQNGTMSQPRITMISALLDAFESTGDIPYLSQAQQMMDSTIDQFWDGTQGGFYDIEVDRRAKGLMATPWKDIIDGILPATNGLSAQTLMRLAMWTGDERYQALARENLQTFKPVADQLGLLGSTYGQALIMSLKRPPVVVLVVPPNADASRLLRAANRSYRPGMGTVVVDSTALEGISRLPITWQPTEVPATMAQAWVCADNHCSGPFLFSEDLEEAIHRAGTKSPADPPLKN